MDTKIAPRSPSAVLRVAFDSQRTVKIDEVRWVLERFLGQTGCPTCGLGGLDIILRKTDILAERPRAFTATLEGLMP
ncbi:MAG TPA: hypothetical protein VGF45_21910 [Polyangia bacterium]